jgi:hypothetical protein
MESFFREHARQLDDFLWLLAPASQPDLRSLTVGDGFTSFPSREDWAALADDAPLMLLLHREDRPQAIDSLVLILPAAERGWAKALTTERHGYAATLELLPGAIDTDWVLLSAIATPGAPTDALYTFIGRIFARFLVSGRPLRGFHGSFMLPLDLRLDDELEQAHADIPALAVTEGKPVERLRIRTPATPWRRGDDPNDLVADYLSTPLQARLFETDATTNDAADIIHWRIPTDRCRDWRLQVIDPGGQGYAEATITEAAVDDVSLYQYYNGLFLLALRVSMPPMVASAADGDHWWQLLLFSDGETWAGIEASQIARWVRLGEGLRRLYPSFGVDMAGDRPDLLRLAEGAQTLAKIAPDSPFSEVVAFLLRWFLPVLSERQLQRGQRLRQVSGPQMFMHSAYTLLGPEPIDDTEHGDYRRLFDAALLGTQLDSELDTGLDSIPRSPRHQGYKSGFTALGNAFIGSDQRYASIIAPIEVPYLYAGLQIPVLFFRASLDLFERRIADAAGEEHHAGNLRRNTLSLLHPTGSRGQPSGFDHIHSDFIEFSNRHWLPSLSPQVRGAAIAERMMAAQDLPGRYQRLADRISRANDAIATLPRPNDRPSTRGLAWAGIVLVIGALVLLITSA